MKVAINGHPTPSPASGLWAQFPGPGVGNLAQAQQSVGRASSLHRYPALPPPLCPLTQSQLQAAPRPLASQCPLWGSSSHRTALGQGQLLARGAEMEVPAAAAHLTVSLFFPDYEIPGEFLVTHTEPR